MIELPMGWDIIPLEKIVEILDSQRVPINSGERAKRIENKNESELYPYYGATGKVGYIDDFLFNETLILLGEDGVPFFDLLRTKAYQVSGKYWVNNHAHVLKAIPEVADQRYISAFLNSFDYTGYVSGSTRLKLTQASMKLIPVPLAPLNEQKRIADKLDRLLAKVDNCRERLDRIPLILKHFRQSILAAATAGKLTEDWRTKNTDAENTSDLLKKIQDTKIQKRTAKVGQGISDLFDLPPTWIWARLFDVCDSISDGDHQPPPQSESGVPFLTISNISKGKINFNKIRYVPEEYYEKIDTIRKPNSNDILYTAVGATYGIPVLVETEQRFCFQRHIAILKPNQLINNQYLFHALQSGFVYQQATDFVTGTAQPTVPLSGIRQIKVPIPPSEEQNNIIHQLKVLFDFADRLEARYQTARAQIDKLTPALLDKAFKGELVPQDPTDEPAATLLAKIQPISAKPKANRKSKAN
jgi:type I restriction enzyme, S subunit